MSRESRRELLGERRPLRASTLAMSSVLLVDLPGANPLTRVPVQSALSALNDCHNRYSLHAG